MTDSKRPLPWRRNADELEMAGTGTVDSPKIDFIPIFSNSAIDEFLSIEGSDPKRVLVAGKGLGKTLLLKKKAFDYRQEDARRGFNQVQNSLVSKVLHFLGGRLSYETELLSDYWKWYEIWMCAIGIPIWIWVSERGGEECPDDVRKLVARPDDPIYLILDDLTSSKKKLNDCNAVTREVRSFLSRVSQSFAVFIDNTDEGLQHLAGSDTRGSKSAENSGRQPADIWVAAQLGLLEVAREFRINYPRIRLFITIRREAYDKYPGHTAAVLPDLVCMLQYSKDDVRKIFENNIKLVEEDSLAKPKLRSDPILSLLGAKDWVHWRVVDENGERVKEDLFDAFYRHTLGRPRDLMIVGEKICQIMPASRRIEIDNLRSIAQEVCNDIFNDYKRECVPHWDERYEEVLGRVSSAILRRRDAVRLASKFKDQHPDLENPLVFFAKRGLLGFVKFDHIKRPIQAFSPPGMSEIGFVLPTSPLYFFHPILGHKLDQNHRLKVTSTATELETRIVVGNGNLVPADIYKRVMLEEGELWLSVSGTGHPVLTWDQEPLLKFSSFQSHTVFVFACLIGFAAKRETKLTVAEFLRVIDCCEKEGLFGGRPAEAKPDHHAEHMPQLEYFRGWLDESKGKPEFVREASRGFKELIGQGLLTYSKKTISVTLHLIAHTQILVDPELRHYLTKVRSSLR